MERTETQEGVRGPCWPRSLWPADPVERLGDTPGLTVPAERFVTASFEDEILGTGAGVGPS